MGGNPHRILFFWHSIGNRFLIFISNMFSNLNLTDMETCYKLFRAEIIKSIKLRENRFGFEPEVTSKIARVEPLRQEPEAPFQNAISRRLAESIQPPAEAGGFLQRGKKYTNLRSGYFILRTHL